MTSYKEPSEKESALFINNLLSLSSACLTSITLLEKSKERVEREPEQEEEEESASAKVLKNISADKIKDITRSIKDYRACLTKIKDNQKSHGKFFDSNRATFENLRNNLTAPIFQKIDNKERLVDSWIQPNNNSDQNGYMGATFYISKEKKPSYCVPVSECYKAALTMCSSVDIKYKYIPARILYFLFLATSSMEESYKEEYDFINEVAVNADRFKEMANLSLEEQPFDFDGLTSSLTSIVDKVGGEGGKMGEILGDLVNGNGDAAEMLNKYMGMFGELGGDGMAGLVKNLGGMISKKTLDAAEQD